MLIYNIAKISTVKVLHMETCGMLVGENSPTYIIQMFLYNKSGTWVDLDA